MYLQSSLNRPVFSIYSTVFFIIWLSPSNTLDLISFSTRLSLHHTVHNLVDSDLPFPFPRHSHSGVSMLLKRCRYSFRWQWPVRSRVIHTTCFRCCKALYSLGPVVGPGYWLIFRRRLAFSLPISSLPFDFGHGLN